MRGEWWEALEWVPHVEREWVKDIGSAVEEIWNEQHFLSFFVSLFPKKNYGFMGLLDIGLVAVFMGLFLGFIFYFSGFDGDWVWLLDLDLGFARDWFGCFLDLGRI